MSQPLPGLRCKLIELLLSLKLYLSKIWDHLTLWTFMFRIDIKALTKFKHKKIEYLNMLILTHCKLINQQYPVAHRYYMIKRIRFRSWSLIFINLLFLIIIKNIKVIRGICSTVRAWRIEIIWPATDYHHF